MSDEVVRAALWGLSAALFVYWLVDVLTRPRQKKRAGPE